ncbi:aminoacyl-histidine dipeptidase [Bacteroidota bacterium]
MESTRNLSTSRVWDHFEEICKIPRPSKSEDQIIEYVLSFARKNNLESKRDEVGNVIIHKPASKGKENLKTVILQSHLDMVGEKEPDSGHDFERDPIIPVKDGQWIRATGTTLGADCGIGIAAQLVILEDKDLVHGALECLFTVDEESGMTGAKFLKSGFMKGKILLNLDSEDEGELFIGCAGGVDTIGTFKFNTERTENSSIGVKVLVGGLKGGHSGDEIHKSPGNSIKVLNRFLNHATREFKIQLALFNGGNMRNAIPRDAFAVFCVPHENFMELEKYFKEFSDSIRTELRDYEPDLFLEFEKTDLPDAVIPADPQIKFLETLTCLPHGVISWSPSLEGLVETSTNLASVKFPESDICIVTTSQRSSVESGKKIISERVARCLENGGAMVEYSDGYPGWTPNPESEILTITRKAYKELFGENPVVRAIHAGLECGLILEKYEGLDMLSFGPTIKGAHTPTERIHIQSTEKFWKLLLEVLNRIPKE